MKTPSPAPPHPGHPVDKTARKGHADPMSSEYPIVLIRSEEGVAVGCPALPGCWSQGRDEAEAVENIKIAIQEYLGAIMEQYKGEDVRTVLVSA